MSKEYHLSLNNRDGRAKRDLARTLRALAALRRVARRALPAATAQPIVDEARTLTRLARTVQQGL